MYTQGIDAAIILGVIALGLPALWAAWWFVATVGERVGGRPSAT